MLIKNIFNRYGLVGGGINRGENSEDALWREIKEEVGIVKDDVINLIPIAETIDLPFKFLFFKIINQPKFFLVQIKSDLPLKTNWEIKKIFWVSADEAVQKFDCAGFKKFFNQVINFYGKK